MVMFSSAAKLQIQHDAHENQGFPMIVRLLFDFREGKNISFDSASPAFSWIKQFMAV